MARQFADPRKISYALDLYVRGGKLSDIRDRITSHNGSPSLRTLSGWLSRFRRIDCDKILEDAPIKWRYIGFNGLPWDSASYLVKLNTSEDLPSLRRARWWWRIHTTDPHLSDSEVISIVDDCVLLEHMELLKIDLSSSYPVTWESIWKKVGSGGKVDFGAQTPLKGSYAVCTFTLDQELPVWIGSDGFVSITRSDFGVTVICSDSDIPPDVSVSRGWIGYRLDMSNVSINLEDRLLVSTSDSIYLFCPPGSSN